MARIVGLQCLRCGSRYDQRHYADDCPKCHQQAPSNLVVEYDSSLLARRPKPDAASHGGLWRYGDLLPVSATEAVSLGEGGTPLHALSAVGRSLGVAALFGKDETRSPTWSFKDRLACIAVSTARKMGAPAIVSSSTGNAGAAAAAYAAKAGMPCVIFTAKGVVGPLATQMRVYGATVIAVANKADRWPLMQHAVREFGWFPTSPFFGPVVGSNPYGIEGYKTLAYEIAEQMNWQVPDCCVLPVCYGDALLGMWRGFVEMHAFGWIDRIPRLMAAEIYGSLGAALRDGGDALPDMPMTHDTVAKSTTATRSTFQALHVLRETGGAATVVQNDSILEWQRRLAAKEGLYVEPASAGAIAAVAQLRQNGDIKPSDKVVVLLTASGLKDPDATASTQSELLTVDGDPSSVFSELKARNLLPG
ncbi:MAG TPA: pyridoxal-phosphate dependent enzyme [Xanthobacteraceae bacterium]|nr:pyridoxal-phosphate dependent enzyme [Xanthobacteraceae bacterium]